MPNSFASSNEVDLTLSVLDKDHVKITEMEWIELPVIQKNGKYVLFRGNTVGELESSFSQQQKNEDWEKIKAKGVYALLTPFHENADYTLYSNQVSQVSGDLDKDNWDKLLDQYERLVNQYISGTQKMKKGDYEAISDFPELGKKAEELDIKFHENEDEMSSSQWKRYMDLNMKMAEAMKSLMN